MRSRTAGSVRLFGALLCLTLSGTLHAQPGDLAAAPSLRIGIIGTGNIGGALARHWAGAGHELVISSRNPDELEPLAAELGARVVRAFNCIPAAQFRDGRDFGATDDS